MSALTATTTRNQGDRPHPMSAAGFTLLEILIALVVLSIGLLGIAALQGVGLRTSHGAQLTSQASVLAYDIADRIRANPQSLATYNGRTTDTVNCDNPPTAPLHEADLAEWSCAVRALLPNGTGGIVGTEVSAVIGGVTRTITTYTITLEWTDRQLEEGDDPWRYQLVIEI
jgi:type IV pilus assembly protein PilV